MAQDSEPRPIRSGNGMTNPLAAGINPFTEWWRVPDDDQKEAILAVTRALEFACSAILRQVPGSPERTLAIRALMDAHFQSTYAITHPAEVR